VTVRIEVSYRTVTFRNVYYQAGAAEDYFPRDERILHRVLRLQMLSFSHSEGPREIRQMWDSSNDTKLYQFRNEGLSRERG